MFGKMNINGIYYLVYYVPKKRDKRYMASVIYDMEKEREYKNFIVLTEGMQNVKMNDLVFGKNQVLVLEDNEYNREKLKCLHSIDWARIVEDCYDNKVFLAGYHFCDYTDYEQKYVSTFYFLHAEKIYRIKYFLRENKGKNADIVCRAELEDDLRREFPNAHFVGVDLERYVEKVRIYYEVRFGWGYLRREWGYFGVVY